MYQIIIITNFVVVSSVGIKRVDSREKMMNHAKLIQDKIFRRKSLSPGANFVLDYLEIWDKDIL